ncbi:uncharacterized protein LOC130726647, partial [Lotus japonicus]|uniref:uncharacterized protein LOC130726647 n=1 Tax=Lotus japonicus TaxID=34305 RepID=UPI00258E4F5D
LFRSDRLNRTNSIGNDLEKNQVASSRNVQVQDHIDAVSSILVNENHYSRFVALDGCSCSCSCSCSAASQLLNDRWTAAIQSYNNSKDSSEKLGMYSGGTSVWTHFRLPHQIMSKDSLLALVTTITFSRRLNFLHTVIHDVYWLSCIAAVPSDFDFIYFRRRNSAKNQS